MTSSPDNLPPNQPDSSASQLKQINDLIDLLMDSNSSVSNPEDTKTADALDLQDTPKLEANDLHADDAEDVDTNYAAVENLTLNEAIEYQEFLQLQTDLTKKLESEPDSNLVAQADSELETNFAFLPEAEETNAASSSLQVNDRADNLTSETTSLDLVDSVNTLIPLIVELLKYKIDESQESIIKGVTPVLDRIIEERALEDSPKMAAALAKILPQAISQGINLSPEAIAKAIAPELALCIIEQNRLDENAIAEALGSEMGKAIKTQIELEKDAMVDALYPVIGSTISKYMVEVVQDINRKVDNTLSREGIKRKIQAKIQGVSEAELIFRESIGYYVQAVFLIDKDSGIVIQEVQRVADEQLDSGMIAGMLTAIRSFANDCIVSGSELDEIDYGDFQIPIEVAGYCYLAVVVKGEPSKEFRTKIRKVLGDVVLQYGDAIAKFQGDLAAIPPQVKLKLGELIEEKEELQKRITSNRSVLPLLLALFFGAVLIPWGIVSYRHHVAQNIEQAVAVKLDTAPELSIYRLEPYVRQGTLTISGRVPSKYLQNRAALITQTVATQHHLNFDNKIVAIKTPVDPSSVSNEIQRLNRLLNQQPNTSITTKYDSNSKSLTLVGFAPNLEQPKSISEVFERVPGIEKIILNLKTQLPQVQDKIYFNSGSNRFDFDDSSSKIDSVSQFLKLYPQLHLRLIAHSDGQGSAQFNRTLSQQRCQNVRAALEANGINAARLTTQCVEPVTSRNTNQPSWLLRYVRFEPFIPPNSSLSQK